MISHALHVCEKTRRAEINATSQVNAYGWTGLFNGFGDKNSEKLNPIDIMPFPLELEGNTKLMPRTKRVLVKLIKSGELPAKAVGMALQIEEVRKALEAV